MKEKPQYPENIKRTCLLGLVRMSNWQALFFLIIHIYFGFFIATAALMAVNMVFLVLRILKIDRLWIRQWWRSIPFIVFGGLSLYFEDVNFVKVQPTITLGLSALVILLSLIMKKTFYRAIIVTIPPRVTKRGQTIHVAGQAVFYLIYAILNEVVWRNMSTDFWVEFRFWGFFPIVLVYGGVTGLLLYKYRLPAKESPS